MYRTLLAVVLMGFALGAQAQPVTQNTLSGNECWNAGQGPGGPSSFVCVNLVRNSTGYQLIAAATGTVQPTTAVNQLLVNAQPAAGTSFVTPASPVGDGALFSVCNVTAADWAANASTLNPAVGQAMAGGAITTTTLLAHSCVEIQFVLATTTWYRIR